MCELGPCVKFTRVEICRTFYIKIPLMNKVGFLIQVKGFGSELRKQTLWKRNDENTDWQWILEYKPSTAFTHSPTARIHIWEIDQCCVAALIHAKQQQQQLFPVQSYIYGATPRMVRVLFRLRRNNFQSSKVYTSFLDGKQAFDHVWHSGLFLKLMENRKRIVSVLNTCSSFWKVLALTFLYPV